MQEKRTYPRVPIDLSLTCQVEGKPAFEGIGRDISLGGMFIDSAEVPAFGTAITIAVELPGIAGPARLPAVVRWSSPGGFGVQFGLLGARETHAITRVMKG